MSYSKIIGYTFFPPSNDGFMIDEDNTEKFEKFKPCNKCKYITEIWGIDLDIKIPKKILHISDTYDFYTIVSDTFIELFPTDTYKNVEYIQLNKYSHLYVMKVNGNVLSFDYEKRKTEFIKYCDECGKYKEVIGADPVYLKNIATPLLDGFYQTDIQFGSENCKRPLYIIGLDTYEKMKSQKFKNLYFEKVFASE